MNSLFSYLLALALILCFVEYATAQWGGGWGWRRRMMGGYPYGGYGGYGGYGMGGYGGYGMYGWGK